MASPFETRNATAIWWRFFKNSCRHTAVAPPFDNTAPCNDCTMVRNYSPAPPFNNSIKMEVGIEECLHREFEYGKSKYHLKDVIVGKIYFLLVRIKIKTMELERPGQSSTPDEWCSSPRRINSCEIVPQSI
uniref:Uncharacterized protein n=1 Tax=Glycine max TaxID=3847 RepID=K7N1L6_SOYBN